MVLKFALLISLFLALAALALPPSQLGARLARGEDPPPPLPPDRSLSIIRRNDYSWDWAGAEYNSSFGDDGTYAMNYVTVTFQFPEIRPTGSARSEAILGISLGDTGFPGCNPNILVVGIQASVMNGRTSASPVGGTNLNNIRSLGSGPIEFGDTIVLRIFASSLFGGIVVVENQSQGWIIRATLIVGNDNFVGPICDTFAAVMVIAVRIPHALGRYWDLADFGTLAAFNFAVHHVDPAARHFISPLAFPLADAIRYVDIRRGPSALPITYTRPASNAPRTVLITYTGIGL